MRHAFSTDQLDFDAVCARLPPGMDAAAWAVLRPNVETLADAADWWGVVEGPVAPAPDVEPAFLAAAADAFAAADWSGDPWHAATAALKASTGRKGRELIQPLRRALAGRDHVPEMAGLLKLIGRERALARPGARP